MSDSLTAINLFRTWPSASGAQLLPTWKAGVQMLLNSFPGLTVHFAWCPGHSDIASNEWADAQAKAATDLPPSSLAPSISALKEQSTLVVRAHWSHQLARPLASTTNKYLAVTGPPTRTPHKLLTLLVDHPHHELSTIAQVLCHAGPYGGYWLSFNSAYRHVHGLIPYCRWHNHPPWPVQSTAHILGSCDAFQVWIPQVWPANHPPPWPTTARHLNCISDHTVGSIRLAITTMDLDGLPTSGVDFDLNVLRDYVCRYLGPRTQDMDLDPALLELTDGTFTQSEEEKGELFCTTFFKEPPSIPDTGLPPVPPPPPPVPPLLASELEVALSGTSNLSAPGPSGISYCLLKWVVLHYPVEVLALFNDCLRLGHHPECWRAAKVVMLRKPNKKDPFSLRSYHPITLEETLGKLLKKIIANRLQFLANEEDWLPPNQYGRRQGHSVYDASQHLLQIVERTHSKGLVCSILAVDIQGFFNSVHLTLLHQQLVLMGCPLNMADWCLSFMMGRSVSISFDGTTLPTAPKPSLGTPQGSPVSPILSTIFTGLALRRFQQPGCNLLTYMDNHLIICIGPNIASNCDTLAATYRQLDGHFLRLGLNIKAMKTEALHFHPPWCTVGYDNWRTTGIQITPTTIIKPTNPLRWLGIWWDPGLSFKAHVERMRSKGLSTLAALCILGNTERSISALLLWQLYSACICTVLAWGAPVWFHGRSQKTLVNRLQAVQNTACRWILGIYKGASPLSTNFLCSTPPFFAYFEYLKTGHALHLWRTPHPVRVPHVQQVPAYMHPPWTDPLAFGQGRINFEVPPIPVPSEVFTDGSRIGTDLGSAICAMHGTCRLRYRHLASPKVATATDAEILSLAGTPGWAATHLRDHLMEVSDIHFMSDSLTAINLFRTWPSASGAQLLPTWKAGMQTLLDSFPSLSIHFAWCPGHSDIAGNEWADAEAKAATDLPPSSLAPSISALKEQSTLVARMRWSHQLACPLMSTTNKYLAVTGPLTWTPRKLLTLFVDHPHHELSTVAQVLCHTGPYGDGTTTPHGPSSPLLTSWAAATHSSEWADEALLPVLRRWLRTTGHLNRISDCTTGSIQLAFTTMDLDSLPTSGTDSNLNVLQDYVHRYLGPRTQDMDPDLLELAGNAPPFPSD
ncbi:hypothetical protein M0805_009928 [Coniferiporia weirii]|nr:hypothetical protein M0805_009928 [Coniferiporia weirii]